MSKDFSLEELKKMLLDSEWKVGFDEHILLMAEFIDDAEIIKASEELVEDLNEMFKKACRYNEIEAIVKTKESE